MTNLVKIVSGMDAMLETRNIPDYGPAQNGLQLTNDGTVTKIAAAVDASFPVIKMAVEAGADMLLVHHGLFWQGVQPFVGAYFEKIKYAMDANLAIYSSHIPLDIHPEIGNNVILAREVGIVDREVFFDWKGIQLGVRGQFEGDLDELILSVEDAVGVRVHRCVPDQSAEVGSVGIITGGAGSEVAEMAKLGVKTFITGEGPHWSYPLAEELGVNVIYAGHYATETFGVKALAKWVGSCNCLEWVFLDHPTGL